MISKNWMYKIGVVVVSARAVFAYLDPGSGKFADSAANCGADIVGVIVRIPNPGDLSTSGSLES